MDKGCAKYKIKISGDGAKMTRLTNFPIMSFAILNDEKSVMSSNGNSLQFLSCTVLCKSPLKRGEQTTIKLKSLTPAHYFNHARRLNNLMYLHFL